MIRVRLNLITLMAVFCLLIPASQQVFAVDVDDYLYEPSVEFLDDFFLAFAEEGYIYPESDAGYIHSTRVLRQTISFQPGRH